MKGHLVKHARPRRLAAVVASLLAVSVGLAGCGSEEAPQTSAPLDPQVVEPGSLTVCTSFPYAPFEFRQKGEPTGFDIDLAKAVADELGVELVVVNADFEDDIQSGAMLNAGECDVAIAAMTITGERARVLDFSSPYFDTAQAMVVVKGSGLKTLDDLSGAKIGVQEGSTSELYVTDNAPDDAEIVAFADASEVDAALQDGDVDAGIYDSTVVGPVVSRNDDFEIAAEFETGEQYGMAVKKNGSVDLLRFINDVLANLRADGGYDKIYDRWFA
jgi:polar amino acid transport system substrate-binding protein